MMTMGAERLMRHPAATLTPLKQPMRQWQRLALAQPVMAPRGKLTAQPITFASPLRAGPILGAPSNAPTNRTPRVPRATPDQGSRFVH